jgi:pSer/pThr/pTyr-binding forkhead associated (FHA) protein
MASRRITRPPLPMAKLGDDPDSVDETAQLLIPKDVLAVPLELPANMKATFTVMRGTNVGAVYILEKVRNTLGRDERSDIRVPDKALSRIHAIISYAHDEFRISDAQSVNGTLLNGSKVSDYALRSGDTVQVGETLLGFKVVVDRSIPEGEP